MFRSLFRSSGVLRSAFFVSDATTNAAHTQTADVDASSAAAAAMWQQTSSCHQAHAADSSAADSSAASAAEAEQAHSNALVLADHNNTHNSSGGGYLSFSGGCGPQHLAEVAIVPSRTAHGRRGSAESADAAAQYGLDSEPQQRQRSRQRPVITKARRIRLAAAATQAAELLQAAGSPAAAQLHSQRIQQLQAEEALLSASLQRLKAERDLATVRHTCDEELHNFQRGVAQREREVLLANNPKKKKSFSSSLSLQQQQEDELMESATQVEPVVSYSQVSGGAEGAEWRAMAEADLLGMPATADAEAAAAAAAGTASGGAVDAGTKKKKQQQQQHVLSARAKLHRERNSAQKKVKLTGKAATAKPAATAIQQKQKKSPKPVPAKKIKKNAEKAGSRTATKRGVAVKKPLRLKAKTQQVPLNKPQNPSRSKIVQQKKKKQLPAKAPATVPKKPSQQKPKKPLPVKTQKPKKTTENKRVAVKVGKNAQKK